MSIKVTTKHLYIDIGQVDNFSGLFYQTLLYQKQNVYDVLVIHYHYENTNYLFNINQWILNS